MRNRTVLRYLFTGIVLVLFSACWAQSEQQHWQGIRDGVFHIKVTDQPVTLSLSWKAAWQADGNEDWVFLQAPDGSLIETLHIAQGENNGARAWVLPVAADPYRLEVTGYSFREFTVELPLATPAVFEPVKHHFSMATPNKCCLYFRKTAATAQLGLKYHGDADEVTLRDVGGAVLAEHAIVRHGTADYYQHTMVSLDGVATNQMVELTLNKTGKIGLWLEHQGNYFAAQADNWFEPQYSTATAQLLVSETAVPATLLGVAVPYTVPPQDALSPLQVLSPDAISSYMFVDNLTQQLPMNAAMRDVYHQLGAQRDVAILSDTGRNHHLSINEVPVAALASYFADPTVQSGIPLSLALADEPNLNYADYDAYAEYFIPVAQALKQANADIPLAFPLSSRLWDGPTRSNSAASKGVDWLQMMVSQQPELVDEIAWNEWLMRDLRATTRYAYIVEQVADLERQLRGDHARRPLTIAQTNPSSGLNLSPYEQDTFFAALWWASVVANVSNTGELAAINWFKLVDDSTYRKGLLTEYPQLHQKPVAQAMAVLTQFWRDTVLVAQTGTLDLDALVWRGSDQYSVLLVNKSERDYALDVASFLVNKTLQSAATYTDQGNTLLSATGGVLSLPPLSFTLLAVSL